MNKNKLSSLFFILPVLVFAQELKVNNTVINIADFKKENDYGLKNTGVEKTIEAYINYRMMQDFANKKKVDTTQFFQYNLAQKEKEIRVERFYPDVVIAPVLSKYLKDNKVEYKIKTFFVQKTKEDKTDYKKIYNEVLESKISMEDAIKKYAKDSPKDSYIKPGYMDISLDEEIRSMSAGAYTSLINNTNYACFVKLIDIRPSLGYTIFGTISYPNDAKAPEMKQKIQEMLNAGTAFELVAQKYGFDENETKKGGVVMGSPAMPSEVYLAMKTLKVGQQTPPILIGNQWFIFNIYSIRPYETTGELKNFYKSNMEGTNYTQYLDERLVDYVKQMPEYKESEEFNKLKNSFDYFKKFKNDAEILYAFRNHKSSFKNFKDEISQSFKSLESLKPEQWKILLNAKNKSDLLSFYEKDFLEFPENKALLDLRKKEIIADFFYNYYVSDEFNHDPKVREAFFNKNKSKYQLGKRAKARVILPLEVNKIGTLKKEIKEPKNWTKLKEKYGDLINDKKQLLVTFEEGEMQLDADVFTKHDLKFETGVQVVKIGEKSLIIAIDEILPERSMTIDEAMTILKDDFVEEKIKNIIDEEKKTAKILGLNEFKTELEKIFKK